MNNLLLFKVLADKSRLQILNSLLEEPMVVERLASRLNLAISTVSFHLKKLEEAGLVESYKDQYYKQYTIKKALFNQPLSTLITLDKDPIIEDRDAAYRNKVIETFFNNDYVEQLPVQRKKRFIILEEIAKAFHETKIYDETEVNEILMRYHDDYCTLRRDLVDFKFLARDHGHYKKLP